VIDGTALGRLQLGQQGAGPQSEPGSVLPFRHAARARGSSAIPTRTEP
jgi:hypothetical protein